MTNFLMTEHMTECARCGESGTTTILCEAASIAPVYPEGWKHSNIGWLCPECVRWVEEG